jgi:uroporphyrinogen decarboxylase
MDRIERVKTALAHREPDVVPTISCIDVQKQIYDILGEKPDNSYKYFTNPFTARLIDVGAPLLNRMGLFERDVWEFMMKKLTSDVIMGYDATWALYANIFLIKDSKHMTDIFGRLYKVVDDGYGNMDTPMYIDGMLKSPQDWHRLPKRAWERFPEKMFRFNVKIKKEFGDDIYLFGSHLYGVFENIWQPFGFPTFARLLKKERGFIEEAIEYNKDWYIRCIDASVDAGLPGIIYSDDMAYKSGPMLNPLLMEELWGTAFREITDRAHKKGLPIVIHTDGNTMSLLPYFIKWGFDGQHSLEPTAGVDLGEVRDAVGHKLSLLGHLDIAHVLSHGTREEVYDHVRDVIRKAAPGGGLVLGPCNSHADIKVENIRYMMEAVREYGRYPIRP